MMLLTVEDVWDASPPVIRDNSRDGEKASLESKQRADGLKNTTGEAQNKTTQMYRGVQEKSAAAMEQARAVEKINKRYVVDRFRNLHNRREQ